MAVRSFHLVPVQRQLLFLIESNKPLIANSISASFQNLTENQLLSDILALNESLPGLTTFNFVR